MARAKKKIDKKLAARIADYEHTLEESSRNRLSMDAGGSKPHKWHKPGSRQKH